MIRRPPISNLFPYPTLFRSKLAEVPLGLDYPYWIDDADFDIDFHVRELALPAPGSDEQLAEQVARIFSRPLDRSRPLWELDRKSTRLNSSHANISYAVFCLK